jgi:ATP-dependent DNA helicase RecQ
MSTLPTTKNHPAGPRSEGGLEAGAELFGAKGRALFDVVRRQRLALARRAGVPPYLIASDRTLREIALLRPRNLQELEFAHGIGSAKREKCGADLIAVVSGEGAK